MAEEGAASDACALNRAFELVTHTDQLHRGPGRDRAGLPRPSQLDLAAGRVDAAVPGIPVRDLRVGASTIGQAGPEPARIAPWAGG